MKPIFKVSFELRKETAATSREVITLYFYSSGVYTSNYTYGHKPWAVVNGVVTGGSSELSLPVQVAYQDWLRKTSREVCDVMLS